MTFLAENEDVYELVLAYLDPLHCSVADRNTLLPCWKTLGGAEDRLRQGHGDDVTQWEGIAVEDGGTHVEIDWRGEEFKGRLPAEFVRLSSTLRILGLTDNNVIGATPHEYGSLYSPTILDLAM